MPATGFPSLPAPAIAAIVHAEDAPVDALIGELATGLGRAGWRVRGLVQPPRAPDLPKRMVLVDVEDPQARYDISQPLGPGACGCSLDPAGVAAASVVLRRALEEGADLVLANRFGTLEASGSGLAAEMLALMAESVPLLTVVNLRYLEAWRAFTGGAGVELSPHMDALQDWCGRLPRAEAPA
ncbi:MAG: DUF2478 domain-containing protein [Stenotrophomonas sp.]